MVLIALIGPLNSKTNQRGNKAYKWTLFLSCSFIWTFSRPKGPLRWTDTSGIFCRHFAKGDNFSMHEVNSLVFEIFEKKNKKKLGANLKGKNLLPEGANSSCKSSWEISPQREGRQIFPCQELYLLAEYPFSLRLIVKSFLWTSFSPFCWFKKAQGNCQLLAKCTSTG